MTVFRRVPREEVLASQTMPQEIGPAALVTNIKTLLGMTEHDTVINRHANYYEYMGLYQEQGIDLDSWYKNHARTAQEDAIKENFLHNKQYSFAAKLAEMLPLLANTEGRLGPYLNVTVTKTAKPDDQGNSFIDLVIEIENTWLAKEAPLALQDVPAKMTFLVDMTTATSGVIFDKKVNALRDIFLLYGEKANVKCYKNRFGDLGIERPKLVVARQADYIEKVGASLGDCVTQLASDNFSITKPDRFNRTYQAYFLDLMTSIGENARQNVKYIQGLKAGHQKRDSLCKEYQKIIAFVEAYKKTPVTR